MTRSRGIESDGADIVFEILAKKEVNFCVFYVVFRTDQLKNITL